MTTDKIRTGKIILAVALAGFAGTAFAGIAEIANDANLGKNDAQKQLATRYASGNEVVKDDLLAEQWLLRADPKMSPKSGGNALEALQKKQAKTAEKTKSEEPKKSVPKKAEMPKEESSFFGSIGSKLPFGKTKSGTAKPTQAKKSVPAKKVNAPEELEETDEPEALEVQLDDFQRLLRAASQGNRLALQRFRTEAELANRLKAYAQTPDGKRNPFVREVIARLKNQ